MGNHRFGWRASVYRPLHWAQPRFRRRLALGLVVLATWAQPGAAAEGTAHELSAFYKETASIRHSLGACSTYAMDCSCFIQKLFSERFELQLPRTTREQAAALRFVKVPGIEQPSQLVAANLCAGDLIYTFKGKDWGSGSRHVAVYADEGRVLHSSAFLGGVGWSPLAWLRKFKLRGVYRAVGC